jgi:uncharacterized tellurite resistance protein B-like protein
MSEPRTAAETRCLRAVLAAMIIVDDDIDPAEIETACRIYARATGESLDPDTLRSAAGQLKAGEVNVEDTLAGLSQPLDYQAKERILEAALDVASADGFVLEEEETLLATIAAALGITEGQYRRTMSRLLEHR